MYDTDGIENTNNNKTKHQNNRGLKIVAAVFCLATIISLCGLIYMNTSFSGQVNKLEGEVKTTKEELAKANETVSKYETATGTKAVEAETENAKIKEIVKPMAFDANMDALRNKIESETHLMNGEVIEEGLIEEDNIILQIRKFATDSRAKFLFATTQVSHELKVKPNNSTRSQYLASGGPSTAVYYKSLPNGDWKKAVDGNGIPGCDTVPQEVKDVLKWTNQRPFQSLIFCVGEGGSENYGNLGL